MKKFVLSIMTVGAMLFATEKMQAQVEEVEEIETEIEVELEQEEFTAIEVMQLPQAVKDAIATDYNGAVTSEAWVKAKGETKVYKIKLEIDGETEKVFVDQDGKWLEKENLDHFEK